ncbi:Cupredoxin, partial [Lactifluus subvellereus]
GGADININLDVTFNAGSFLINDVAFEPPTVPVLLQILNGVQASDLVPAGSIYSLDPDKSVEISLPALNSGTRAGGPHPIHLHGHAFHVVRSAGSTAYNYDDPVIRDVVSMGNTGDNVTIRFFTDNPGPWFLHCHIDWHLEEGFAVVFAEDVPGVSNQDVVTGTSKRTSISTCECETHGNGCSCPEEWRDLCPAYNNFIG